MSAAEHHAAVAQLHAQVLAEISALPQADRDTVNRAAEQISSAFTHAEMASPGLGYLAFALVSSKMQEQPSNSTEVPA